MDLCSSMFSKKSFPGGIYYSWMHSRVLGCFSKCDFWNLWKISVRHSKKYFWKKSFFEMKKILPKKSLKKSSFFTKNLHFCFENFPKFFIENVEIFLSGFFPSRKNFFLKIFFTMSNQNFPKISEIALRKASEHSRSTFRAVRKKNRFFLY